LVKIFHTVFDGWDQDFVFSDEGVIGVFFSFSGGVDVDELGIGVFQFFVSNSEIFFGSSSLLLATSKSFIGFC